MVRIMMGIVAGLVLAHHNVGYGQVKLVGDEYKDVSAVLTDIGAKSLVYRPTGRDAKELYYVPFFAMKADKQGKMEVAVLNGPTAKTKTVAVWLLLSPQKKLEAVAEYIRAQEALVFTDRRFADVQAGQLIGLLFSNLEVVEEEPRIGFKPVRLTNYAAQGEIQMVAELASNEADKIAVDLKEKRRLPVFVVRYDLHARKTISQSDLQAELRYFSDTRAAQTLLGSPKTSEKFGWKVGPQGVKLEQPFVTRDQRGTFEGRMRAEVKVLIQLEDERDTAFLQTMQGYFDKVFQSQVFDTDKTPLGQQLANMSAYGIDPKDISPDKIDELVADVKNFFNQEDADKKTYKVGTSASYAGFGGSANAEYNGETLRKMMKDKGWTFESKGNFRVPKLFEVYVINDIALKTEGVTSGTVLRGRRAFARFNNRVSASNLYYPESVVDHLADFETLKARVKTHEERTNHLFVKLDREFAGKVKRVAKEAIKVDTFTILVKDQDRDIPDPRHPGATQVYADGKPHVVKDYGTAKVRLIAAWYEPGSEPRLVPRLFANYNGAGIEGKKVTFAAHYLGDRKTSVAWVDVKVLYIEE